MIALGEPTRYIGHVRRGHRRQRIRRQHEPQAWRCAKRVAGIIPVKIVPIRISSRPRRAEATIPDHPSSRMTDRAVILCVCGVRDGVDWIPRDPVFEKEISSRC